jgi:uncharacterized protein
MEFEWDENKASSNLTKHSISFEEAKIVFQNNFNSITFFDPNHSFEEERYIEIGLSAKGLLLAIVYVEREGYIRIISARKATLREIKLYDQS